MAGVVRACNVTIYYVHLQCRLLADVLYLYSGMLFDIENNGRTHERDIMFES